MPKILAGRRAALAALLVAAPFATLNTGLARADAPLATVRVVHGIPGRDVGPALDPALPVDVLVNGKVCLLRGFTFTQVAGPFSLPAGTYTVQVSLANTLAPCSERAVISARVALTSGENAALVAALSPSGAPTFDAFPLSLVAVPKGEGRVMVAHAAAAPAVDVLTNTSAAIRNIAPRTEKSALVPAGTYQVRVVPAGGSTVVTGPVPVAVGSRAVALVFAVGSVRSGSIQLLTRTIADVF